MVLREGKQPSRRSERENRLSVAPRSFQASTGFGIGALRPLSTRPRPDPVHRPLPLRSRHGRRLFLHLQVPRRVVPAFACYGVACSVSSHIVHGWSLSAMSAVDCTASANANESPTPASVGEGRAPISALHPASSACCAKREPFISGADQLLRK